MISRPLGGILLIAGTTIGASLLALPLVTAEAGILNTAGIYLLCWATMTLSALYLLEVNLFAPKNSDMVSMAQATLGPVGSVFTWVLYLMLLYALTAAYITGGAPWVQDTIIRFSDFQPHAALSPVLFTGVLALVIYAGIKHVDALNRLLMLGLLVTFALIMFDTAPVTDIHKQLHGDHHHLLVAIPVIVTAYGYHIIIPSLVDYIGSTERKTLVTCVAVGSILPSIVYLLWTGTLMSIIPMEGPQGLKQLAAQHASPTELAHALESIVHSTTLPEAMRFFSLFALITSFLGVSISLFHFLKDGLAKFRLHSRLTLGVLTFVPPLAIAILYPRGFTYILGFAGSIVAILLGILPAMMAWQGRYHQRLITAPIVWGGKPVLLMVMLLFAAVIPLELYSLYGGA